MLKEPLALRVCRATNHLKSNLLSGFTTIRDLGTEGAGYADVGLKQAIEQGIIPGPRMLVTTRAIVATGRYAPKGFAPEWHIPQGAEEADGAMRLSASSATRSARGPTGSRSMPTRPWAAGRPATFSLEELKLIVETARSAASRWRPTRRRRRGCGGRRWPASRRSSTATAATWRSSG